MTCTVAEIWWYSNECCNLAEMRWYSDVCYSSDEGTWPVLQLGGGTETSVTADVVVQ